MAADLSGRTAIVTGASRRIGLAIAEALVAGGANGRDRRVMERAA